MNRWKRRSLAGLAVVAVAAAGLVAGSLVSRERHKPQDPAGPEIDPRLTAAQVLPDAVLAGPGGNALRLRDVLHDRKAVVLFLSTTCPPCSDLMRECRDLFANAQSSCEVIGIAAESPEAVDAFAASWSLSFPILIDPEGRMRAEYNPSYPTLLGVDEAGVIAFAEVGYGKGDRGKIEALIEGL